MDDRTRYTLEKIAEALERIAAAAEEQNKLLSDCIITPNDAPARIMLGFYNPLEVIKL